METKNIDIKTEEKVAKKVMFVVRQGTATPDFTRSLIGFVSHTKTYDVEYYVTPEGGREQDTLKIFTEKMKKDSVIVLVSPMVGFKPDAIDKVVESTDSKTVYGVSVPTGVNNFAINKFVQNSDHARIMTASFELTAKNGIVQLDKSASVEVSSYQKNDILCIPYEVALGNNNVTLGYEELCKNNVCRICTQFATSYMGIHGCLLEQLRHIVHMRGLLV